MKMDLIEKIEDFCDIKLKFFDWPIEDVILLRDNINKLRLSAAQIDNIFKELSYLEDNLENNIIQLKNNSNLSPINLAISELDYKYKEISRFILDNKFIKSLKDTGMFIAAHKLGVIVSQLSDWIEVLKSEAINKERMRIESEKLAERKKNKEDSGNCNVVYCPGPNLN